MTLLWTPTAQEDLEAIAAYYEESVGPELALSVVTKIKSHTERLANFPKLGKEGRVKTTQELVIPRLPYITAYWTDGEDVHILAVIHTSKKWPKCL